MVSPGTARHTPPLLRHISRLMPAAKVAAFCHASLAGLPSPSVTGSTEGHGSGSIRGGRCGA
jgi:hypothetical protein